MLKFSSESRQRAPRVLCRGEGFGGLRRALAAVVGLPAAALLCLALTGALLTGCSRPFNAPRALDEYAGNTLFSSFSGRSPRTLDPQQSYSSDETIYVYGAYEMLYGYHYLKRPYTLVARAAERVAPPVYYDKEGRELPADAH